MSIRTLWSILLRVLGLLLISTCLHTITGTYAYATAAIAGEHLRYKAIEAAVISTAIFLTVMWALLFKTDWIIDLFRLDQGFKEEKIDLTISDSAVLRIAIIVIGGITLLEGFPWLVTDFLVILDGNSLGDSDRFLMNIIKTVVGLVLMTQHKSLVSLILKKANE